MSENNNPLLLFFLVTHSELNKQETLGGISMKTHFLGAACVCAFTLAVSTSASAALVDRGGGMIYDTDLNLTWLADANYAMTSGYSATGSMTWQGAMDWASNLSYGGYTGWRLPNFDSCTSPPSLCSGGTEMYHLFYNELGGVVNQSITTTHNTNYDLFQNVQSYFYWTGVEYPPIPGDAYYFNFNNGGLFPNLEINGGFAWAVRPGDVAAVPLPAAAWLFGSGLLGLIGIARRKPA
jgi:hypothetical protein